MTVRRVMGIETEYGIMSKGGSYENHMRLSQDVIDGAANSQPQLRNVRWSYEKEDPVNDARGYHTPRSHVRSDLLTDSPALHSLNVPQINGGRIYVDHAHPEYSSPEVLSPLQALVYDRAGDKLMSNAAQRASSSDKPLKIYRNNTDGKGASWGSHENYQVLRAVPFAHLAAFFTTHAVSRQIFTGSGRVRLGQNSETPGFQLSQRADFFTTKIGLQTTFDRPIVNTRDESHSSDAFRRFHVIVGDANRMDVPELLKLGTTSLIFWALEESIERGIDYADVMSSLTLEDPVEALHTVSRDMTLRTPLALISGEQLSAFQLQLRLRTWVYAVAAQIYGTNSLGEPLWPDDDTIQTVTLWSQILQDVARIAGSNASERLALTEESTRIEWLLKWQILESMCQRKNVQWDAPLMQAMDISWGSLADDSLWDKVKARCVQLAADEDVNQAMTNPPEQTRAYTRGTILKQYPDDVLAVSWDSIAIKRHDMRQDGSVVGNKLREKPHIIKLEEPQGFTKETVSDTFTPAHNIESVCAQLSSLSRL